MERSGRACIWRNRSVGLRTRAKGARQGDTVKWAKCERPEGAIDLTASVAAASTQTTALFAFGNPTPRARSATDGTSPSAPEERRMPGMGAEEADGRVGGGAGESIRLRLLLHPLRILMTPRMIDRLFPRRSLPRSLPSSSPISPPRSRNARRRLQRRQRK